MEDNVVKVKRLPHPPDSVWDALTDPVLMRQWYFPMMPGFRPIPGFETQFTVSHGGRDFVHLWKVVSSQKPELISYKWRYAGYPGESLLEFRLIPDAGGTRLELVHSGLRSFDPAGNPELSSDNFNQGWSQFMPALQNFLSMITIHAYTSVPPSKAWEIWTDPKHIVNWNFATPEWHCPRSENDLREGGRFSSTMAARDGSMNFDFEGTYSRIEPQSLIEYEIADGRKVSIAFEVTDGGTRITETFEPEGTHPVEMQRQGWQSILDNFARYAESAG